jgi:hypothetical protein
VHRELVMRSVGPEVAINSCVLLRVLCRALATSGGRNGPSRSAIFEREAHEPYTAKIVTNGTVRACVVSGSRCAVECGEIAWNQQTKEHRERIYSFCRS